MEKAQIGHAGIMESVLGPEVIYEDEDILVVNKPAGLLVHSIIHRTQTSNIKHQTSEEPTLVDWLLTHYPGIKNVGDPSTRSGQADPLRPGIVHRLDRETSGVMLIAKNQRIFDYLKSLFMTHAIQKEYIAIVWGAFRGKEGVIDTSLGIVSGSTKRSTRSEKMAKPAVTRYLVERMFDIDNQLFSFVRVFPKTGRTHQIRVHLASISHPIVGDALYSRRIQPKWAIPHANHFGVGAGRLMLHAFALQFKTSAGSILRIEAPQPDVFEVIEILR